MKKKCSINYGAFFVEKQKAYFLAGTAGFAGVTGAASFFTTAFFAVLFFLGAGASFFTGVCAIFELTVAALPAKTKPKTHTEINANFFMILIFKLLFFYSNFWRNRNFGEIRFIIYSCLHPQV
jgi:hypothetical protein